MNAWHSAPEVYDDALDAQIHKWYSDILSDKSRKVWPPRGIPYFSPSSANADPRGLYEKMRGAKRESGVRPPHQGRWVRLGTAIGDMLQRDILFAEKHMDTLAIPNTFSFERNDRGEPMFEDFAKKSVIIEHRGKKFALYGTGDGIMRYVSEDGEVLRVGLEIKSKQTTSAMTSAYSKRNGPKEDHVKQCVCYSIMYDVDIYVIIYVNGAKKSWNMTEEDFAKNPDIAAYGVYITDDMRNEVLDHFADIVTAAETGNAPKLDIERWLFNDFKRAISKSLTADELVEIEREVSAIQRSRMPDFKKQYAARVLAEIMELRNGGAA
ncbi:hypothetical protein [Brevibacillus reuszeri]|uniref:hypothetical protein n=1 Tax=Brevibacillus reuszeri TaxID=54915 RepID=UPI001F43B0B8|nr:hypothetical protein [Brevibacillus reuszeri]